VGGLAGTATAPLSVVYALVVEGVIHRTLGIVKDVPNIALECATFIGGFLIIPSVALGFTSYLILLEVPETLVRGCERTSARRSCFSSRSTSPSSWWAR
jgi:TRAP-type C4-dicarboxylate transport system permease large subunit